uniref:hypothetical protein n=1 Tax=Aliivibrio sp. SR45-2 TaxID=2760931 RepID=UPI0015FD8179
DEERKKIQEFSSEFKNTTRLTDNILNVINSSNDEKKADVIACLFIGFVSLKIDDENFRRSLDVINNIFVDDLVNFLEGDMNIINSTYKQVEFIGAANLINTPLIKLKIEKVKMKGNLGVMPRPDETKYGISMLGHNMIKAYKYGKKSRNKN